MRIDEASYTRRVQPKPAEKPAEKPQPTEVQNTNATVKKAETTYLGDVNKTKLEKQFAERTSPGNALNEIQSLPTPDPNNKAAVTEFKAQRAKIAENAIRNSQPPKFSDYTNSGLNGATASFEYREAATNYNSQINELKKVSADSKNYPDKILTPGEAVIEIDNLPRPDRNNPSEIQDYNNKRASIADSALMYAKPPSYSDYKDLPGGMRRFEYSEAVQSYNNSMTQLREASQARYSSTPPLMTDAEADKIAQEYINKHNGGKEESDGYEIGKDTANLAKTDPEGAALVMKKLQEKLKGTDREDDVSSGFTENTSLEDLRKLSQTPAGAGLMEDLKKGLQYGRVSSHENDAINKINEAATGFNPNSLTGNAEQDAKTVDQQLKKLPPEMRDDYVKELMNHPYGGAAMRFASVMSPEGQEMLGKAIGELYNKNPTETAEALKQITSEMPYGGLPYYYQSGLAQAIGKSGNDNLIKSFAQNEIDRAKSDPNEAQGYVNAATAYAGLSPEGLQDVMKNNPDFYKTIDEAGKILGGPASSGGFENYNIWNGALGDLMKKASQIKGADGKTTPEALKLFETVVKHAGSNFQTMEGLGAFFIEHAQEIVDKYTNPEDPNALNSTVLRDFFGKVVYSPIGNLLKYNGKPMVEQIMGNEKGEGGVIGEVVQKYLDEANKTGGDGEKDYLLGQRIGVLWAGMSNGFLDMVQANKDKWKEDKEFRDFTIKALSFGLGKIADKFGVPGAVVDKPLELVQKMLDSRAEKDQEKQIEAFKTAFKDFNTTMFARLNSYDQSHPNVENMNSGFSATFNLLTINQLIDKQIES